ncbi:MAG: MFS transporter [Bacteroidales bacterium]|nr:MFS transporter [Bacteroidales bacterium]
MTKAGSPWAWVPTLYFFEGIPYFLVNVVSVTMFKRLGMDNASLAALTSLLYLPWVIKPLWSPLVDVVRTKRWWILAMQTLLVACFAALAFSLPHTVAGGPVASGGAAPAPVGPFIPALVLFYIGAMLSATHDIAADGFYMLALDSRQQSLFVGIRSTFYRISSVFGQGVIVVVAGLLEERLGTIPKAWSLTLLGSSALLALLSLWHFRFLPHSESPDSRQQSHGNQDQPRSFWAAFGTFFAKPGIGLALAFMLLFRLPEALSVKMLTPFMLDPASAGGLGLSTTQSGLVYGTVGVIALTIGGILGGIFAARVGLRKAMWPMALSLALPCAVYLYMAMAQPSQLWVVYLCVAFDQFGYGFGFTAYMLYLMYFSDGAYKTSHYAICTAFMALSMMVPGFFAGWLQQALGYTGFFVLVMICCLATVAVTAVLAPRIRDSR